MGVCLIFTGKLRSISGSLSPLKPRKVSNGMSKPSLIIFCAAVRAVFVRHITACHSAEFFYLRGIKIAVFTIWTDIVRRQRIDLRNT